MVNKIISVKFIIPELIEISLSTKQGELGFVQNGQMEKDLSIDQIRKIIEDMEEFVDFVKKNGREFDIKDPGF